MYEHLDNISPGDMDAQRDRYKKTPARPVRRGMKVPPRNGLHGQQKHTSALNPKSARIIARTLKTILNS
jgi:hypothetical protein